MTLIGWGQILLTLGLIGALTVPVGRYLVHVFDGGAQWLGALERPLYRFLGVDPSEDQHWTRYATSLLVFSAVSMLLTYVALRLQALLPLNPAGLPAVVERQAFETAASFVTNTNWQSYSGESTMSYGSQMLQLTLHNFASAAAGVAVAVALVRGLVRRSAGRIGNFWADLLRGTLYVFLPASAVLALLLVQGGVVQTLAAPLEVTTLEGGTQVLQFGAVASQEAIKQLGTNGGGFFNANAAHPFENPTPWTNLLSLVAILAIPAGLTWLLGRMCGRPRHGWAVFAAMMLLLVGAIAIAYHAEASAPALAARGVATDVAPDQAGGNLEGKEVRFGIAGSALYAAFTTAASCGAVNAMHDSFTAIGGMVPMTLMLLGEVVFGGVGAGLYGMVLMVVLTVFLAGLMVGRTPEYLGKRVQAREVRLVMLSVLLFPALVLGGTALAVSTDAGLAGRLNAGPHGLSEILYAFASTAANNGSAFAGLSGGSPFYNTLFGIVMLLGRFAMIVPVLALAGALAERRQSPTTDGTFPVDTPLFVGTLVGVILVVGALTFFPALALGPIADHLLGATGRVF
jgi:K+-transporting ATPase ATPase A chain